MLARLIQDRMPEFLACCSDEDWRPQWRVDLIPSYKTHRLDLPATPELDHQIPLVFDLLRKCGLAVVGKPDYEAEDIIGALAPKCHGDVEIVSGDRDLFQLVRDGRVVVLYPKRGVSDLVTVNERYIEEMYGIPGRAYGDFAILRGDASDGLPGVAGIGEKTASSFIAKYGSLEKVIEAAVTSEIGGPLAKVRSAVDYLDRAVQVVLISPDLQLPPADLRLPSEPPHPSVLAAAESQGLLGAIKRLVGAIQGSAQARA